MIKNPVLFLEHILNCIDKINEYTKGISIDTFLQNSMIQDAVIRNFEIIGEATKNLNPDFRAKYPEVEWKKIAGLRDKLIHDYLGVDLWAVWAVVEQILPDLRKKIAKILTTETTS